MTENDEAEVLEHSCSFSGHADAAEVSKKQRRGQVKFKSFQPHAHGHGYGIRWAYYPHGERLGFNSCNNICLLSSICKIRYHLNLKYLLVDECIKFVMMIPFQSSGQSFVTYDSKAEPEPESQPMQRHSI